jgi:methylated-DNA-[protein]-cysteine S-methyltransferase
MTAPIGSLVLSAHNGHLTGVTIVDDAAGMASPLVHALPGADAVSPVLGQTMEQLAHYFVGRLRIFRLPVDLSGLPPFTRRVLETLQTVPYGATITYGELAARVGNPGAARAVGRAMATNPLPIIIPCHRVIAVGGKLCGYSGGGGVNTKQWLLAFEQENCRLC